jgi:hypothetical protein
MCTCFILLQWRWNEWKHCLWSLQKIKVVKNIFDEGYVFDAYGTYFTIKAAYFLAYSACTEEPQECRFLILTPFTWNPYLHPDVSSLGLMLEKTFLSTPHILLCLHLPSNYYKPMMSYSHFTWSCINFLNTLIDFLSECITLGSTRDPSHFPIL